MPFTSQQKKPRRWAMHLVKLILIGLVGLVAAMVSFSPALPEPLPLSAQNALEGRRAISSLRQTARTGRDVHVRLTWEEAQALVRLGEAARGQERFAMAQTGSGEAQLKISKTLPLGLWINATAWVTAGSAGKPMIHGQIGHVPVPAALVDPVLWLGRWWLERRGISLPHFRDVVHKVALDRVGLSAHVTLPANLALLLALPMSPAVNSTIDAALVEAHYCRLVTEQRVAPEEDFAGQVNRAFAGSDRDDDRVRLLALAMLTGSPDLVRLVGKAPDEIKACPLIMAETKLLGRRDLARHWSISAALTATMGAQSSAMMGLWKEMADSVPGGSGFSYADLAADKAGVSIAQGFSGGRQNPALKAWLAKASAEELLPIQGMNLPEGLATSEPDPAIVNEIEAGLAARLPRG